MEEEKIGFPGDGREQPPRWPKWIEESRVETSTHLQPLWKCNSHFVVMCLLFDESLRKFVHESLDEKENVVILTLWVIQSTLPLYVLECLSFSLPGVVRFNTAQILKEKHDKFGPLASRWRRGRCRSCKRS